MITSLTNHRQGIWKCKGLESDTVFPEVDLEDGEWVDYDEKVCPPTLLSTMQLNTNI